MKLCHVVNLLVLLVLAAAGNAFASARPDRAELLRRELALREQIRQLEQRIAKAEDDRVELLKLAAQAEADMMLTSATIYRQQARQFEQLIRDLHAQLRQASAELREVQRELHGG
jgi:chromosome segregation ATPase